MMLLYAQLYCCTGKGSSTVLVEAFTPRAELTWLAGLTATALHNLPAHRAATMWV
jgi:hypothetical protein